MRSPSFPSASSQRIDSLDILRGLMALSVAVYHLSFWTKLTAAGTRTNEVIAILGNYGVEGFFIVSGFCFFHLYTKTRWSREELTRFHIKRFFRIAPLYYLAVILNLVLGAKVGPDATPRMLLENGTLTFGLFHPNHSLVLGGWSIGIEYVFYLALPLLVILTRRPLWLYILAVAFIAWAYPWSFGKVQAASHLGEMKFHTYVQIPNHAFLFLLGGILARLRSVIPKRFPLWAFLGLLTLVVVWALPRGPVFYDHFDVMAGMPRVKYAGLCFLVVALFAFFEVPKSPLKVALVFLGDASYSVYLLHPFAYRGVSKLVSAEAHPVWTFIVALGVSIALAGVVYRWIERPAMRFGKRISGTAS